MFMHLWTHYLVLSIEVFFGFGSIYTSHWSLFPNTIDLSITLSMLKCNSKAQLRGLVGTNRRRQALNLHVISTSQNDQPQPQALKELIMGMASWSSENKALAKIQMANTNMQVLG